MKERYGFISVFARNGDLLGYVPNVYKSNVDYVKKWLTMSRKFYNWNHFVLWIDKEKIGVFRRSLS